MHRHSTRTERDASGASKAPVSSTPSPTVITPQDPIIMTSDGGRLPGVPLAEAAKLNALKEEIDGEPADVIEDASTVEKSGYESRPDSPKNGSTMQKSGEGSLRRAMPPSR